MFKYAFDYCSQNWCGDYGIPDQVFFSYLDLGYYEMYLP